MKPIFRLFVFALVVFIPLSVWATELPAPSGEVILTVKGDISNTNRDDQAIFDLEAIQSLDVKTYETHTPWSDHRYRFKGVTLESVLRRVGASEGDEVILRSLDGYQIELSWEDATQFRPILAFSRNNVPLNRRDRGPLWLIYPFDLYEEVQDTRYDHLWIWQVAWIEVR